jgi:hypothetical protein
MIPLRDLCLSFVACSPAGTLATPTATGIAPARDPNSELGLHRLPSKQATGRNVVRLDKCQHPTRANYSKTFCIRAERPQTGSRRRLTYLGFR